MKAIVYEGVKDVRVEKVADPAIENDDDIIVKVTSTAICGSDLHLGSGDRRREAGRYGGGAGLRTGRSSDNQMEHSPGRQADYRC